MTTRGPYQKIGTGSSGFSGGDSLWLAKDHVLAVLNHRFTEDYVRFYLKDIQAIIISKRMRFHIPALMLLAWIGAVVAAVFSLNVEVVGALGWIPFGLLVLAWLAMSIFGSCAFHIQTAVNRQEVPSLNRIWTARKALSILEQAVEAEQGKLPPDWEEGPQPALQPGIFSPPSVDPADSKGAAPRVWVLPVALVLLILDGALSWVNHSSTFATARVAGRIVTVAAMALALAGYIASRSEARFGGLGKLLLTAFIVVGLVNYGTFIAYAVVAALKANPAGIRSFLFKLNEVAEFGVGILGFVLLARASRGAASLQ